MHKQKPFTYTSLVLLLLTLVCLLLLSGSVPVLAAPCPAPVEDLLAADLPPTIISGDEEGYTIWTVEAGDTSWCVPISKLRYPIDLDTQDPTRLSDASLILTFNEGLYTIPDNVIDPSWSVALNGDPPDDWQIVGEISAEPRNTGKVWVTEVIPFDAERLIDGENNIWLQQHDDCPQPACETCACTCIELSRWQLRAAAELLVESISPAPETQNVAVDQRSSSQIRVKFTSVPDPDSVKNGGLQLYYRDWGKEPVYVAGKVKQLSTTEFAFVPDAELKDGIRYWVRVWGEEDARSENHDAWVQDPGGGALEAGRHWSFWTLPELNVKLIPVQVVQDVDLIAYKPTVLKVFVNSTVKEDVWPLDQWKKVEIDDVVLTWRSPSGDHAGSARWKDGGYQWHFERTPETALRKRYYDKADKLAALDSINYYGFRPEESGACWIRAAVELVDSRGEKQDFTELVMPDVVHGQWLDVPARAVAVGSEYGKTGTTSDLRDTVLGSIDGIKALYPVPAVSIPHPPSAIPYYRPTWTSDWSASPGGDLQLTQLLVEMSDLCALTSDCSFLIGYVPMAWLGDIGLTLPELAWSGALVQAEYLPFYRFVAAHEGGHLYGFEHDTFLGYEGFDVRRRSDRRISVANMAPQTDKTRNTIKSFMNIDPVELPPTERLWINTIRYTELIARLRSDEALHRTTAKVTEDSLLLASGFITPTTGQVALLPWYQIEPGPWTAPAPGPYELVFLDGTGQEILGYTQAFSVATTLQPVGAAPRQLAADSAAPFTLKVPYPATMARAQIRRVADGTVLAEMSPGASAPTLSIDSPASATWVGPQTLSWQSDAAGPRYFALQVSTDGGATWEALALHLTGTNYTLETTALPNTTQAWVRVAASDGLGTTTASAGPFTIDNPPAVAYVSPAPGTTHVNVDQPLYVGFRDAMDPASLNGDTLILSGGPFGTVTGTITYDATTYEATFMPEVSLAYSTTYTAQVTTGVRNAGGVALSAGQTWTFTTEADIFPPRPLAVSPADGATGVPLNPQLVVAWDPLALPARASEALDAGTINTTTFLLATIDGEAVSGAVSHDAAAHTSIFSPAVTLAPYTTYVVTLTAGIQDTDGNTTVDPEVWTFTTGDAPAADLALTGAYVDYGLDSNGDGLYEQLVIKASVQVSATGSYGLRGILLDGDGAEIAATDTSLTLPPGGGWIDLVFDGAAIGGHGVDGPYMLADLTLSKTDGGTDARLQGAVHVARAHRTFAYAVDQFPAPLRFTGLPDLVVLPDTTQPDAFNVHDYAQHVSLTGAALTYTLVSNSDLRAGVTLAADGSVDVTPQEHWLGSSEVTLRASDGTYAAQDTCQVRVGWPVSLYLPTLLRNEMGGSAQVRDARITLIDDSFEEGLGGWRTYSSISTPPYGPGGWYSWAARDCAAYSGQYSAWPFGGNDDGALLPCGAAYPDTLWSTMCRQVPINLKYVRQAQFSAKVWTDLAPGDEICLMATHQTEGLTDCWQAQYYGVCRSGQTNGWEDMVLDLSDVPTLGNLLGEEEVWVAIQFHADESGSRPAGAYIDDALLWMCPQGLDDYCAP